MLGKKIISLFVLLGLTILIYGQQRPNISDPRLPLQLATPQGDSLSLVSQKGKVVLLDFWASWCGPCRVANKQLVKLYAKYKSQGFEIFGVSFDQDLKAWKKAITKDKITWMQVNDPRGPYAQTATDWNIYQLPTTFLINKQGEIVAMDVEGKHLENEIARLLKE